MNVKRVQQNYFSKPQRYIKFKYALTKEKKCQKKYTFAHFFLEGEFFYEEISAE
jgi:hypothetical protein